MLRSLLWRRPWARYGCKHIATMAVLVAMLRRGVGLRMRVSGMDSGGRRPVWRGRRTLLPSPSGRLPLPSQSRRFRVKAAASESVWARYYELVTALHMRHPGNADSDRSVTRMT